MQHVMRNVMLLEDEMIIAIDIEDTLRGFGASEVHALDTSASAIEWLAKNTPSVAVIDPRLRDGYCTEVVRQLVDRGIPFVIYSGDRSATDADIAFDKGVWLMKPAPPEALRSAIATFER